MGYDTHFYGKLSFTTRLDNAELAWLEWVMCAPDRCSSRSSREYSEIFRRENREWDNEIDNARMHQFCDDLMKADGFVQIDGMGYAGDMRIADERDGLVYASEKSYDLVDGINFIIANARRHITNFGLKGELYAETDFEPCTWLLRINAQGWAQQVPCRLTDLPVEDQKAFRADMKRRWIGWSQTCAQMRLSDKHKVIYAGFKRHIDAKYGYGSVRSGFRKAADAVCFGTIHLASRVEGRLSYEWDHLIHG